MLRPALLVWEKWEKEGSHKERIYKFNTTRIIIKKCSIKFIYFMSPHYICVTCILQLFVFHLFMGG